jgi:hypothetical protein
VGRVRTPTERGARGGHGLLCDGALETAAGLLHQQQERRFNSSELRATNLDPRGLRARGTRYSVLSAVQHPACLIKQLMRRYTYSA